jgi:hypothetical protein
MTLHACEVMRFYALWYPVILREFAENIRRAQNDCLVLLCTVAHVAAPSALCGKTMPR